MRGHDKITPKGKAFFKHIEEFEKLQVRVGYQQGKASDSDSGADIVDIAVWNELGTEHSPARPFLRQSIENNASLIAATCKEQVVKIVKGKITAKEALNNLGIMQKGLIQNEIKKGDFEPNAPITVKGGWITRNGQSFFIKGKKSNQPLIDTSRLRQSVNYVIEEKGDD